MKKESSAVQNLVQSLVPADDFYLKTHTKRLIRTLEVLLEEDPSGSVFEVGTSNLIPIALQTLAPSLTIEATHLSSLPLVSDFVCSLGNESRQIRVYNLNIERMKLPIEDETYDFVICTEVIEHMERDPMFMMSELNRVMKPRAKLILTTPNILSSRAIYKMLHGYDPYFYMQYRKSGGEDRHNYEYSVSSIKQVVESAGFYINRLWTEDTFEAPFPKTVQKLKNAGFNISNYGDNIFCVAEKTGPVKNRYPDVIYSD